MSETIAGVIIPDTAVVKAATELVLDPGVLVGMLKSRSHKL